MAKKDKRRKTDNDPAEEKAVAAEQETAGRDKGAGASEEAAAADAGQGQSEFEKVQQELSEAEDRFLRSKAELDNYRRRVQREFTEVRQRARNDTIEEFLPVFDHFQMAMAHIGDNPDVDMLKQGMDMIMAEFRRTFESLGVQEVNAEGQEFNPSEHEAMAQEPSSEVPAGHVLRQWKCGYRLGERLLRPATVVVSSGPANEQADEAGQEQKEEEAGA